MKATVQVEGSIFFEIEIKDFEDYFELLKKVCLATGRRVKSMTDVGQTAVVFCPPNMDEVAIDTEFGELTYN